MWKKYSLPTETEINGHIYKFNADFRNILDVFAPLNDPDLLDEEKMYCALNLFYDNFSEITEEDLEQAILDMALFINGGKEETETHKNEKPLYSWEQDFDIIIAPINRIAGHDLRNDNFVHWWTFLSMFMEIGECTFNTYVSIRDKKNRGKKLEKWEKEIFDRNRNDIILKKKYDSVTQDLLDEIMNSQDFKILK